MALTFRSRLDVKLQRDKNNFAPRFSFAYTPKFFKRLFGEDITVIRGGFAVNYDVFFNNILSNTVASSPNAIGVTTFGTDAPDPIRGFANASNTLPTEAPAANPLTTQSTVLPNLHNPKTYVWNFGIQRQLPWKMVADVAYVGSRGIHLFINEELNPRNILVAGRPRVHPDFRSGSAAYQRRRFELPLVADAARTRIRKPPAVPALRTLLESDRQR